MEPVDSFRTASSHHSHHSTCQYEAEYQPPGTSETLFGIGNNKIPYSFPLGVDTAADIFMIFTVQSRD